MFHKLLLRMSVNFMAVLMIVLLVLGALVSRFMWLNRAPKRVGGHEAGGGGDCRKLRISL